MSLKILHTSDWHLGKKIYKTSRLAEQKLFLDWLLEVLVSEEIDALIVAGDIFDTPRPSDQTLQVYFSFLQDLLEQTKTHLYLISGNHDSGRFLEAPKAIIDENRVHLCGVFDPHKPIESYQHRLSDEKDSQILVTLMPYFRSFDLAHDPNIELAADQQILDSLSNFFQSAAKDWRPEKEKHILVAHHLFGSFQAAGSEQGLNLSGLETIPLSVLDKHFDYVALGHIHNPQWVKHNQPKTRYSGSPVPFRFSEIKEKSVTYIHIEGQRLDAKAIPVPVFRPLIQLKTTDENYVQQMSEVLKELPASALPALIEVICEIKSAQAGLSDILREMCKDFPCELVSVQTYLKRQNENETGDQTSLTKKAHTNTENLFEMFYLQKFPDAQEVPEDIKNIFHQLLEKVRLEEHQKYSDEDDEALL